MEKHNKLSVYTVKRNYCNCHPETCGCNDWAVYADGKEKISSHFSEEGAHAAAERLNNLTDENRCLREMYADLKKKYDNM